MTSLLTSVLFTVTKLRYSLKTWTTTCIHTTCLLQYWNTDIFLTALDQPKIKHTWWNVFFSLVGVYIVFFWVKIGKNFSCKLCWHFQIKMKETDLEKSVPEELIGWIIIGWIFHGINSCHHDNDVCGRRPSLYLLQCWKATNAYNLFKSSLNSQQTRNVYPMLC